MNFIFWAILIYFLYVFTVRFLIPVLRTSRKIKQQVQAMQQQQQNEYAKDRRNTPAEPAADTGASEASYADKGEYIDFEEVKNK